MGQMRTQRRGATVLLTFGACVIAIVGSIAQRGAVPSARPGRQAGGATLLPNGWRIAPAGKHVQIGDLPLNMAPSPDGRFLVITNNGLTRPTLTVFDTKTEQVIGRVNVDNAWLGLAWSPDGSHLYSAGAAENTVYDFAWTNGSLKEAGRISIGPPERRTGGELLNAGFIGGLAISPNGQTLYAVQVFGAAVSAIDVQTRKEIKKVSLAAEPYTALISSDARTLFVSLWGGGKVLMFAADTLDAARRDRRRRPHPNAMLAFERWQPPVRRLRQHQRGVGGRPRVATAKEQISVALYPNAPVGTTPNSLALSPDGTTLLVANADNNTVAIVDVKTAGCEPGGRWVPVGWYPTSVMFSRDGSRFFVLNGKGLTSEPNPRGPQPGGVRMEGRYTANMLQGALSIVPMPDAPALRRMTRRVLELTPYKDVTRLAPAGAPIASPDSRAASAAPRRSSTCSTSSARTAPTIRCSATSRAETAIRR